MTDTLTHALTIHQPYAWAVGAGHKPIENRTWRPPLEAVGKPIGIHAGLTTDSAEGECWRSVPVPRNSDLVCGALIGVARLVGVVVYRQFGRMTRPAFFMERGRGAILDPIADDLAARIRPWWRGPWGWFLEEAVLLPEPIPMRGYQGLWRISGSFSGPSYDEELGAIPMTYTAWALEQWRKARETR